MSKRSRVVSAVSVGSDRGRVLVFLENGRVFESIVDKGGHLTTWEEADRIPTTEGGGPAQDEPEN